MLGAGIIFVGHGSDHTLNLDPQLPGQLQELQRFFLIAKGDTRDMQRSKRLWSMLCDMAGGADALGAVISREEFFKACSSRHPGGLAFLYAIGMRPYLVLAAPGNRDDIRYDPSKSDLILAPAFAAAVIRAIVAFAKATHLPHAAHVPAPEAPLTPAAISKKPRAHVTELRADGAAAGQSVKQEPEELPGRKRKAPEFYTPAETFCRAADSGPGTTAAQAAAPELGPEAWQAAAQRFVEQERGILDRMLHMRTRQQVQKAIAQLRRQQQAIANQARHLPAGW